MFDLQRWSNLVSATYMGIIVMFLFVVAAFLLVMFVIALVRGRLWEGRVRAARRQAHRDRHRADGTPYPPTGRGMCDRCQQAFEKVYHLPSGRRLCPDCYELEVPLGPVAKENP